MGKDLTVGFAFTGSYCTFSKIVPVTEALVETGIKLIPIFSERAATTDTRFGMSEDFVEKIENLSGNKAIRTIAEAEPIGPKKLIDVLVIAPCTGNTISKIAGGIADTSVTLAVKSHLRNNRPVVIAVSTNDGLGGNAVNIGKLLARKNIYMVPFGQDDCYEKENSLVADFNLILPTINAALEHRQLQPLLI